VHWLAFTGETWTMSQAQLDAQMAFIKADLAKVDRAATPWVVAYSHKVSAGARAVVRAARTLTVPPHPPPN